MTQAKKFRIGSETLTVRKIQNLLQNPAAQTLPSEVVTKISTCQQAVRNIVDAEKIVYSINTGFGALCRTKISKKDTSQLQVNILRSHSVGVGELVPDEISHIMLLLKAQALSYGYSGVAPETVQRILWHCEHQVLPVVPCQGSVGASGDLAPLAHLFLPLIGQGQVRIKQKIYSAVDVLNEYGLKPLVLGPKEGLALINGTQFIAAYATLVCARLHNCLEAADLIGALSLEAMQGSVAPFRSELHALRPHPGAKLVAHRLHQLLKGSEVLKSHANCDRVQDPYSLRCMPQIHGTSRDAWRHFQEHLLVELNAVTDNPIILNEHDTISGGNFHGQPLALPLDYVAMAASELGNVSERRTYLLLEGKEGLPLFLMKDTGLNSGFMIPQYTAAALVSENKSMCFPASVDSIPTSNGQEDHVSMGSISGRKALNIVANLENILAIELLCAAQAFDFRRPLKSSPILEACHDLIRKSISHADGDRIFADDIAMANQLIVSGALVQTANAKAQSLGVDLNGEGKSLFELC